MARVRQPGAAAAASFGQSGSVYAANGDVVVAPEGKAIVAIQLLANSTFTTLTPVTETTCFNTAGEGYVSGGTTLPSTQVFSAGIVVYGEWSSATIGQAAGVNGAAIMYFA
jgi:hypothetical protein